MSDFAFRSNLGLTFVTCVPLAELGFINAFSTRSSPERSDDFTLGHSNPEMALRVQLNRMRYLEAIGAADRPLVTLRQIHSAEVVSITGMTRTTIEPPTADALTANQDQLLAGIQTADCLPILVADPRTGAFAGIHAGWRGTLSGIVVNALDQLRSEWGSRMDDLHVALGPAIGPENFQVGPEVLERFIDRFPEVSQLISKRSDDGRGHLDLNQCNVRQLVGMGVRENRIYDSRLCTISRNDLFFSYRKERGNERPVGRMLSVIGRK